jgi:hypothetical protein
LKDISIKSTTYPYVIRSIKLPNPPAKIKESAKYSMLENCSLNIDVKMYKDKIKHIRKTKIDIHNEILMLSLLKKLKAIPKFLTKVKLKKLKICLD